LKFRDFVFGVLSGRVVELMQTLEEAGSTQLEQRVAHYLIRRMGPDGTLRMTQIGIASDLGTAREVVSRALRSLAGRGLVSTSRSRVSVTDQVTLRAFAGAIAAVWNLSHRSQACTALLQACERHQRR